MSKKDSFQDLENFSTEYRKTGIFDTKNYMAIHFMLAKYGKVMYSPDNMPLLDIEDCHCQEFLEYCYIKNINPSCLFKNYSEKLINKKFDIPEVHEKIVKNLDFKISIYTMEKSLDLAFTSWDMVKKLDYDLQKIDVKTKPFPREAVQKLILNLQSNLQKLSAEIKNLGNDKELLDASQILLCIFSFLHMRNVHRYTNTEKNIIVDLFANIYLYMKNKNKYRGFLSKGFRYSIQYDHYYNYSIEPDFRDTFNFVVEYTPSRLKEMSDDPTEFKCFFKSMSPTILSLKSRIDKFDNEYSYTEEQEIKNELFWFPYYEVGLEGEEKEIAVKFSKAVRKQRNSIEEITNLEKTIENINSLIISEKTFMENWPSMANQIKINISSDYIPVLINIANTNPLSRWIPKKDFENYTSDYQDVIKKLVDMYIFFLKTQPMLHEKLFTRLIETLVSLYFASNKKPPHIDMSEIKNLNFFKSVKYQLFANTEIIFYYKFSPIIYNIIDDKNLLEYIQSNF